MSKKSKKDTKETTPKTTYTKLNHAFGPQVNIWVKEKGEEESEATKQGKAKASMVDWLGKQATAVPLLEYVERGKKEGVGIEFVFEMISEGTIGVQYDAARVIERNDVKEQVEAVIEVHPETTLVFLYEEQLCDTTSTSDVTNY